MTGLDRRTISSTAVGVTPSRSAIHRLRWSGFAVRRCRPQEIELRVVSLPATHRSTKNEASSSAVRRSPSTSAWTSTDVRSSPSPPRRNSAVSCMIAASPAPADRNASRGLTSSGTYSGSPWLKTMLDNLNTSSYRSGSIPIRSQMTVNGRRDATSVTKSQDPRPPTRSTMSDAVWTIPSSRVRIIRGVNPADTTRRRRACRGSSMLIIDPKNSLNSGGRSGMFVPSPEQKASGRRLTSTTSACRVMAQ